MNHNEIALGNKSFEVEAKFRILSSDPLDETDERFRAVAGHWIVLTVCLTEVFRYCRLRLTLVEGEIVKLAVLRSLERDGMVIRTVYTDSPLRVEYRLTPVGKSLYAVVEGLRTWAERQIVKVEAARRSYDETR